MKSEIQWEFELGYWEYWSDVHTTEPLELKTENRLDGTSIPRFACWILTASSKLGKILVAWYSKAIRHTLASFLARLPIFFLYRKLVVDLVVTSFYFMVIGGWGTEFRDLPDAETHQSVWSTNEGHTVCPAVSHRQRGCYWNVCDC